MKAAGSNVPRGVRNLSAQYVKPKNVPAVHVRDYVPCVDCGAPVGGPCVNAAGVATAAYYHRSRKRAAVRFHREAGEVSG